MKKTLKIIFLIICAAVLFFSLWKLFGYWNENRQSEKLNDELAGEFTSVGAETAAEASITVDIQGLKSLYPDVVGWLYCEGTVINYPVAQAEDNDYYLHRSLDGSYNANGTLFLDCGCSPELTCANTIIYGHHMRSGAMFAALADFAEQDFYEEHPVMWYITEAQTYRIDLLACFVTPSDSDSYELFGTQEELEAYLAEALSESLFKTGADTSEVEHILTLSTCAYDYDNARTVVIGRVTPIE